VGRELEWLEEECSDRSSKRDDRKLSEIAGVISGSTDMVFDFVLSGSLYLSRSGIYGEKKSGTDNLIYNIGKNILSLTRILSYLDGQKLLDEDTYVHWLARHSDHADHIAGHSAWNVTIS
jgi:hypothetical protein